MSHHPIDAPNDRTSSATPGHCADTDPRTGHPIYVIAPPGYTPYGPDDGDGYMTMAVTGLGVRRLSRRASNIVLAVVVFSAVVLPLIILAVVFWSMPDFTHLTVDTPQIPVRTP